MSPARDVPASWMSDTAAKNVPLPLPVSRKCSGLYDAWMQAANAIILFGHGSRDPLWRAPMDAVAARIAARGIPVRCSFLELLPPDLLTAGRELAAEGATRVTVVPIFLGTGKHVREDLPRLVEELRRTSSMEVDLRPPVGEDSRVLDLLADICVG